MTDKEKAIVMAYTGICMLTGDKFQIFHKYVEDIMGRPIWTDDIGWLEDEIKEKAKADFMALCADDSSPENSNRWIPVSERLPELDVNVGTKKIPIMRSKPVYISYRLGGRDYVCPIPCVLHNNGNWYNDEDSFADWVTLNDYDCRIEDPLSLEITAWMPLSKPYEVKNEDNK